MTETLYLIQVLLVGGSLLVILRNSSLILRIQILVWMIGVSVVMLQFGVTNQLNFYSNDQKFYVRVVDAIIQQGLSPDLDWWLTFSKIPYTLPAVLLALTGVDSGLALKSVSLLCLLLLTQFVLSITTSHNLRRLLVTVFISACGGVGMLYSILAVRESMMMLFTTYFIMTKNPAIKLASLTVLFLLRPHLAAALVAAAVLVFLWETLRRRRESTMSVSALAVLGVVAGEFLFSAGLWWQSRIVFEVGDTWGISTFTRIFSNLVGLQFLTARSETVAFSITSLLLLRVFLSETILIPMFFTLSLLLQPQRIVSTTRLVLVTLCIYVSLASNTEFNSFRQNIPLMTVMGLVILHSWLPQQQQEHRYSETSN